MKYFSLIEEVMSNLRSEESRMQNAGSIIADSIMNGGVVFAFGSGHSNIVAMEAGLRAGGLAAVVVLQEPSGGQYERIEGVGMEFFRRWDLRKNDCVLIVSNSGRNPLPVELAIRIKEAGNRLIAVTSLAFSKAVNSRHSSGKKLYELADVVLDNKCVPGDSALKIKDVGGNIGPTSSIAGCLLVNQTMVYAVEKMVSEGFEPPVLISANLDEGKARNDKILERYQERLRYNIVL